MQTAEIRTAAIYVNTASEGTPTADERPLETVSFTRPNLHAVQTNNGELADDRRLLREAAPSPGVARRNGGGLSGPLLGGVLAEHGLDDLGDEPHDGSFVWGALRASWSMGLRFRKWAVIQ